MQPNIPRNIASSPSNQSFRREEPSLIEIRELEEFNGRLAMRNQEQLERVRGKWKRNEALRAQLDLLNQQVEESERGRVQT